MKRNILREWQVGELADELNMFVDAPKVTLEKTGDYKDMAGVERGLYPSQNSLYHRLACSVRLQSPDHMATDQRARGPV